MNVKLWSIQLNNDFYAKNEQLLLIQLNFISIWNLPYFIYLPTYILFSCGFIVVPQILEDELLKDSNDNKTSSNSSSPSLQDFITGQGWLNDTIMFYGHYRKSNQAESIFNTYSIQKAYFFTNCIIFLATFLYILVT